MSASVLVGYATRYGSTREVADTLAAALREGGFAVEVQLLREVRTLTGYGAVVVGAPLFMYRWHNDAIRFLSRYRKDLTERRVAVFALGPTHEPHDEQEWKDSRAQLDKELAKFPGFAPAAVMMFGGKFDPAKLGFPIQWLAGNTPATDLLDLEAIRAWAGELKPILAG